MMILLYVNQWNNNNSKMGEFWGEEPQNRRK